MRARLKAAIPEQYLAEYRTLRDTVRIIPRSWRRDLRNIARFGRHCPKSFERLIIRTCDLKSYLHPKRFTELDSGTVLSGEWDKAVKNLSDNEKFMTVLNALKQDLQWIDSGMYERYSYSKKYSKDALTIRYANLTKAVTDIRKDGRLKTRKELSRFAFREHGGIAVHISSQGQPIFAGDGYHRLALANSLNFPEIPVAIRVVHSDAIESGLYRKLILQGPTALLTNRP